MIKQLSIFLENKPGRIADVLGTLKKVDINIYALYVADTMQFGILRMVVGDAQKACDHLRANDFVVTVTDVLAVAMEDNAGDLSNIVSLIGQSGVSIEYLYAFAGRHVQNPAVVVIKPQDMDRAIEILSKSECKLLSIEDIC